MYRRPTLLLSLCLIGFLCAPAFTQKPGAAGDPLTTKQVVQHPDLQVWSIKSTADGTIQKSVGWVPELAKEEPVPLVVVLHTWSGDWLQKGWVTGALKQCQQRNWAVVHPNFRGPNRTPQAGGSDLAVQDVLDAVEYARTQGKIDPKRIYVTGTSGGGHMTLQMVAKAPQLWAAGSSWVPISDVAAWHAHHSRGGKKTGYAKNMEAMTGGAPGDSEAIDAEYRNRSPIHFLDAAAGVPIDINAGIHDGHTGSVPIDHSLNAFNVLARANERADAVIPETVIAEMTATEKVPANLAYKGEPDPVRKKAILFRAEAGPARVTIFDGGHEGDIDAAIEFLSQHVRP